MSAALPISTAAVRLAVVGCGPVGNLHAEAIANSPQAELVAVCDPDSGRRQATAQRFAARAFEHLGELLAAEKIDAVTIATPDHLHVEPALIAMAAGCHVFCEKPLAATLADAEQIVAAAEARGVHLAVDYNRRFAFGYQTAKELLDQGKIGKLNYVLLRVSDRTPPGRVARHANVILTTLLTHHLDLLRWYGGEIRQIQAHASAVPTGDLLRSVSLSLMLRGGAIGTIVAGYRDGQARTSEWLELGGTSGSIVVEEITRRVTLTGTDPDQRQTFEPNHFQDGAAFYDSLARHMRQFIEDLVAGRPPSVSGHDGLIGLKLAAATARSLETGEAVHIS
jgi:UDP-N-acetylglucosamine 3-dehydrogenase